MTIPTRFLRMSTGMAFSVLIGLATPVVASAHGVADCTVPAGLASLFQAGKTILMGEVHGTAEAPAAFDAAVCNAFERGHTVSVGLELGPDQIEPLAGFLASDGGKPAVAKLLDSPFWTRAFQDGRSSTAMLRLIEQLRTAKQRSPSLNVFVLEEGVEGRPALGLTGEERMAARVRAERVRRLEAIVLTLTGNIHSRLQAMPPMPDGRKPTPMGVLLSNLSPRSVLVATTSGTAWVCTLECGVTA